MEAIGSTTSEAKKQQQQQSEEDDGRAAAASTTGGGAFKERFYRDFQEESSALQQLMHDLEERATTLSVDEKSAVAEQCQTRIVALSTRIQDVSSVLPGYDVRAYAEGVKTLSSRLRELRAGLAPRRKFAFKTARRNEDGHALLGDTAARTPPVSSSSSSSSSSSRVPPSSPSIQPPPPSDPDTTVTISNRHHAHISLATSSSRPPTTCTLTHLTHCLIILSNHALTSLTLSHIQHSLLILTGPPIAGPAHMTDVQRSTLVLQCRQFRLHRAAHCDIYLHCLTRPIIEHCTALRFAPFPLARPSNLPPPPGHQEEPSNDDDDDDTAHQRSNQCFNVDDFNHIRPDGQQESPNWSVLPVEDRVATEVWEKVLGGGVEARGDEDKEEERRVKRVLNMMGLYGV